MRFQYSIVQISKWSAIFIIIMEDSKKLIAMFSGIIGVIIFYIGSIIAMLTYPNYSITGNFFSDTGLRVDDFSVIDGHLIKAHPYPWIFNTTLYLTAFFLLPFFLSVPKIMNTDMNTSKPSRLLYYLDAGLGMVIVVATTFVGIYDWGTAFTYHVFAAQTTLGGILLFVLIWALADHFLNEDHPYKQYSTIRLDLAVSIFIIICSYTQVGFPIPNFMIAYIPLQIYQKLAIYSALLYISVIASRLIKLIRS